VSDESTSFGGQLPLVPVDADPCRCGSKHPAAQKSSW